MTRWLIGAILVVAAIAAIVTQMLRQPLATDAPDDSDTLRIVSLSPSVTEILFALDCDHYLVGVTEQCNYPEAARQINSIGEFGNPSVERILSLNPTLVLGTGTARGEVTRLLQDAGIRMQWLLNGNVEEVLQTIHDIGAAVGCEMQARQLVATLEQRLAAVAEGYRDRPQEERPRVFVEVWHDPMTTAAQGSFVDDLVTRAGGVNAAGELTDDYPVLNPEMVVEWNPDVILLMYMSGDNAQEQLAERIGWQDLKAIQEERVIRDVSADLILRPGPRVVDGIELLNQRLYPGDTAGEDVSSPAKP